MKPPFLFFALVVFIFGACEKTAEKSGANQAQEIQKLNEVLKKYEEPAQVFEIPTDKPTKIVGKLGTTLYVAPNDLIGENGQKIGKTIKLELKELHTQEQFIKNGVQTVSDGKLLVSGGAYFIGMSSDNQALKLKEGRSLKVSFPKISDEKMGLFYGERDSLGRMNWVDQKKELEEKIKAIKAKINSGKRGTIFKLVQDYTRDTSWNKQDSIIFRAIYKPMAINQLGWINCDRFFEVPNRTNLKIDFTNQNFIKSATMFVVFKDINSVVEDWYYFSGIENLSNYYQVPLDHNVRLIAFSFENNKIFTYSSDFKITKDHKVLIDLKESNEKELEKLFKIQ